MIIQWPDLPPEVVDKLLRDWEAATFFDKPKPPKDTSRHVPVALLQFLGKKVLGAEENNGELVLTFDDNTQLILAVSTDRPKQLAYYRGKYERTRVG